MVSADQRQGSYVENINISQGGHPLTAELSGKAVRLDYQSGHVLEQHWQTDKQVLWKGVEGDLAGYSQTENYRAFKIAEGIFLISWMECLTVPLAKGKPTVGPWLTDVVLDFNSMRATASWVGPLENGAVEYVLDQAIMTSVVCERG